MANSEELTVANVLAFANHGLSFALRGDTYSPSHIFGSPPGEDPGFFGSSSTSNLAGSSTTSDLYIREEFANATLFLSQHGFMASGTITSLTEVAPVPLPAAAWLMLSGLAALVGVRAWPRKERA